MGKLKHCGIKERKQYISVNGLNSKDFLISYGVPQGSVLGPLFFILYESVSKWCNINIKK